ncbi:MAG: DinB family protein [Bryobacterales bacterium]|nr:DinB family protein [Bryobacterales bacterium]
MTFRHLLLVIAAAAASLSAQEAGFGKGYLPEFDLAARRTLQLAEAIPAEKYSWSPAPGVRTVSQVLMHAAEANYGLLQYAGVPLPEGARKPFPGLEKKVTAKAEVIAWLKDSQDAVRIAYPKADLKKPVKFFNGDTTAEGVYLRILVHSHEHMGQMIAYARTMGVKPPWSE